MGITRELRRTHCEGCGGKFRSITRARLCEECAEAEERRP